MSELIEQNQQNQVAITTQQDNSIMAVISRAALDPLCDIDKMERLMAMHERMQARESETAFNASMAQMQVDMPTVGEGGMNKHTGNAYANIDDINRAIKPVMQKHGFAVTFKVVHLKEGISVTGILVHAAGHREETTLLLPVDAGAGRNTVQAIGSSVTYGKRYVMCALLNITTGDAQDDDGQAAEDPVITGHQAKQIETLLAKCKPNVREKFADMYGSSDQVTKLNFDGVVAGLKKSIAKAEAAQ
jgi:hypothetical protein